MIVTQPEHHIELAEYALKYHIPTMIEKPLALSYDECCKLLKYNTSTVLVNHIHLFSKTYQNIKHCVNICKIQNITTIASSNSQSRNYSRLFDYGSHEIAIILDLAQQYPKTIKCTGSEPNFTITMEFDNFTSITNIGYSDNRQRLLDINNGQFIYDGMASIDLPLTNALQVFIDAIHGKPDYRLGLDLSLQVMKVLEECQTQLDMQAF
jgi:predicted dehydrogenase